MNITQINDVITAANVVNPIVADSKMAAQILIEQEGEADPEIFNLRPYPGQPVRFDSDIHFTPEATRPALDRQVPAGESYIMMTMTGKGKEAHESLRSRAENWCMNGYTFNGRHYNNVYSATDGDDITMVFVTATATKADPATGGRRPIKSINHLGLWVSSDPKASKRVRRELATYAKVDFGTEQFTERETVTNGTVYCVQLEGCRYITVMVYDMDVLDKEQEGVVDGGLIINLPEYAEGCVATVTGPWGQGKGIAKKGNAEYDIVVYGAKSELVRTDSSVFIGALSFTGEGPLCFDKQTVSNIGSWELLVERGLEIMNHRSELLLDGEDIDVWDLFAGQMTAAAKAYAKDGIQKPKWGQVQAMEYAIGRKVIPNLLRRTFRAGFGDIIDLDRMNVPVKEGGRFYATWEPNVITKDGTPDLSLSLIPDTIHGLPVVSIPGAPQGRVLMGRNPNTHPGEFVEVWNLHVPQYMGFKYDGWVMFGRRAGELLGKLNGGDMDDSIMVIWLESVIDKWQTMKYPVQPKIKDDASSERISAAHKARKEAHTGIVDYWTRNVFLKRDLDDYTGFNKSLGSFINKGWMEMLVSGEHRTSILNSLANKTYSVPAEGFNIPSRTELVDLLSEDLKGFVPADYTPTEDNFVAVCKVVIAGKADYRGARAMSNSDRIIDFTVMKKGSKKIVDMLFAEADDLVKMPCFPKCFAHAVPAKRKLAGNYILVETELCKAVAKIEARYNQIMDESVETEQLIVRELPAQLLDVYPEDEEIMKLIFGLRSWWVRSLGEERDRAEKTDTEFNYKHVAKGYTKLDDNNVEIRIPGLIDFYTHQSSYDEKADKLTLKSGRWSFETRAKIVIHWLNSQYAAEKTSDGIPDFMLVDLFMALRKLGLTGRVTVANLNKAGKKYTRRVEEGDYMEVRIIDGILYHPRNLVQLTDEVNPYLILNETTLMTKNGVIVVKFADPELRSDFKVLEAAAIIDEDAPF